MNKLIALILCFSLIGCGKDGLQGPPGPTGLQGPTGPQGAQGPSGQDGLDGTNATPVTVVTLCPGSSSYPGTFVEVGFCINGNLYATYSTNGGFSTLIPPGTYSSNGINSSCTFTVGLNCLVSN